MRVRTKYIVESAVAVICLGLLSATAFAQRETVRVGRKGTFHITSPVQVGSVALQPGMYEVQHTEENGDHLIVFKEIKMGPLNPKGFGAMTRESVEEVARIKCTMEPLGKTAKHTKLVLSVSSTGIKEAKAVQIKGESVLHRI